MKILLSIAWFGLSWLMIPIAHAEEPFVYWVSYFTAPVIEVVAPKVKADVLTPKEVTTNLILATANKYKINPARFLATAKCESNLNPKAIGDKGKSYGLWQIHLPSHPTVTKAQALDQFWATEWAGKKFAQGQPHLWSCFRNLYL